MASRSEHANLMAWQCNQQLGCLQMHAAVRARNMTAGGAAEIYQTMVEIPLLVTMRVFALSCGDAVNEMPDTPEAA